MLCKVRMHHPDNPRLNSFVHSAKSFCMQASSGDERSPGAGRAEGRGKASRLRHRSSVNSEHPARLLDREDSRHYSGFLTSTEELSMDVPDLLASLLELG